MAPKKKNTGDALASGSPSGSPRTSLSPSTRAHKKKYAGEAQTSGSLKIKGGQKFKSKAQAERMEDKKSAGPFICTFCARKYGVEKTRTFKTEDKGEYHIGSHKKKKEIQKKEDGELITLEEGWKKVAKGELRASP